MAVQHRPDVDAAAAAPEYLTFRLGHEEYGIDILKVQEIRGYDAPTRLAHVPAFVKGVINLRGAIVPVFDLRLQLRCARADYDSSTVVIVLRLEQRVVGVVVDAVSDVLALPAEGLRPAPDVGGLLRADAITGLASVDERMLILLDIEILLAGADTGPAGTP